MQNIIKRFDAKMLTVILCHILEIVMLTEYK
jgi:hypothetical protein